jgi:hypothetical protein
MRRHDGPTELGVKDLQWPNRSPGPSWGRETAVDGDRMPWVSHWWATVSGSPEMLLSIGYC